MVHKLVHCEFLLWVLHAIEILEGVVVLIIDVYSRWRRKMHDCWFNCTLQGLLATGL